MIGRLCAAPQRASRSAVSATTGLLVLLASLALASAAMAAGKPKGEFADFTNCPLGVVNVNVCFYDAATSGELVLGKMTIPVKNKITIQGGQIVNEKEETFID